MTAIEIIGWLAIALAVALLLSGASTIMAELAFRRRWKWGNANQVKRSVRLGWNTGVPPEGKSILVREYADELQQRRNSINHGWAVLVCKGDRCYSLDRGFSTPVTNITGWLEIEQPSAERSGGGTPSA